MNCFCGHSELVVLVAQRNDKYMLLCQHSLQELTELNSWWQCRKMLAAFYLLAFILCSILHFLYAHCTVRYLQALYSAHVCIQDLIKLLHCSYREWWNGWWRLCKSDRGHSRSFRPCCLGPSLQQSVAAATFQRSRALLPFRNWYHVCTLLLIITCYVSWPLDVARLIAAACQSGLEASPWWWTCL